MTPIERVAAAIRLRMCVTDEDLARAALLAFDTPEAISDEMVEAARLTYARGDYITTDGDNLNALWAECIAASIRAAADQTTREDDNG